MANLTKNPTGTTVGASKREQPVSKIWVPKDPSNILVEVQLSAVTEATGITLSLSESADGVQFHLVGDQANKTLTSLVCASATDIANATDTFTETGHARVTGAPLIYLAGTAAPTGLVDGNTYYFIWVSANTFKLANTYSEAIQGIPVNITGDGTGNQTFIDARYEIRMIGSDSSDAAQLPLNEFVQVTATTGSGDSVTVSRVSTQL